jgi:2-dehydro-3-deoxyphosphogalactonate aldolase
MNWLNELKKHRGMIAILRGVRPDEVEGIAEQLIAAGITLIEVPLNSPDPFDSIARLVKLADGRALVGAGTVLTTEAVERLSDLGSQLVISPNTNMSVIRRTRERDMFSMPGVFTATDSFNALEAGAQVMKFFPADILGAGGISGIKAVLPPDTEIAAVGGVGEQSFAEYRAKGIQNFGIGSTLYKPGRGAEEVGEIARKLVTAFDAAG